ncbi:MAG: EthD family reductase [Proteobacteria bacterium]|nr:EthD family reductase [Pseudomonadota bacterium]
MIEIVILYPARTGARFDHHYYETKHIPMALELLGPAVRKVTVTRGVAPAPPWPAPAFAAICRLVCESVEAYETALRPHMARLQADLAAYSDVEPVVMIGEVTLERVSEGGAGG